MMHDRATYDAITLNAAPFGSSPYCRALAALAGVKVRKARVFAMAEPGWLSGQAADRLCAALQRYHLAVPTTYPGAAGVLGTFRAVWTRANAYTLGASLARDSYWVHVIDGHSPHTAHGALAAALELPVPIVGAAPPDPVALLDAIAPPAPGFRRSALVVNLPARASAAAWAWSGALLRACGGSYEVDREWRFGLRWVPNRPAFAVPRWHVVVAADGVAHYQEARAAKHVALDGVVRLAL